MSAGGVPPIDSHWSSPVSSSARPHVSRRLPAMLSLSEGRNTLEARLPSFAAQPVDPACSLIRGRPADTGPAAARSGRIPTRSGLPDMHSTPQRFPRDTSRVRFLRAGSGLSFPGRFRPVLALRKWPKIRADKPFTRGPKAWRSGHFGTLVGATGGDPNTLAPNRMKARPSPSRPSRTSTSF